MTKTIRSLVLAAVVGTALMTSFGSAAAESYDTTDDAITVTPGTENGTIVPGGDITLSSTGWEPSKPVNIYLRSDPIFLGTLTANSVGTVTGSFTIPADAPVGDHHIELQGTDPVGNTRVLSYAITVVEAAAANDSGAPDSLSFTGSTALPVAAAGAVLAGLGISTLRFRRRRLGAA